ncbi:MAG: hypothetical protein ACI8RD_000558 [Bacillariaceae sp.]|jgi:hypothetical protein
MGSASYHHRRRSRIRFSGIIFVFVIYFASSVLGLAPSSSSSSSSTSSSLAKNVVEISRRQLILAGITTTTATVASTMIFPSKPANAAAASTVRAKGAAELDLEYYIRDLVKGNKKEGSILPSTDQPPVPPPRKLNGSLLPILLNNECTPDCIPVQALIQQVQQQQQQQQSTGGGGDGDGSVKKKSTADDIAKDIQLRVNEIREKTKRSFFSKAPWKEEDISDQYYFDFTAYALWKTAAELIENNQNRDRFVRNIGRMIINKLETDGMIQQQQQQLSSNKDKTDGVLVSTIPAIVEVLELFKRSGYCRNFRIRSSDDNNDSVPIFDKLDDESLTMVGTANCLVSIYEPATLGASLQINGENSRFAPDFVGTSLVAIWEKHGGIRSTWDVFFVDPEYRPNPKDYFPNEQLLQITLNK